MARSFPLPPIPPNTSQATPASAEHDSTIIRSRLQEIVLVEIRWCGVVLCLPLLLMYPTISRPLTVVLAVALGVGNAMVSWLLHQESSWARLRTARGLATALDWLTGLAVICLRREDPNNDTPALLLVLIVTSGVRYGVRGTLGAAAGAGLAIGTLIGTQVFGLNVLTAEAAWILLIRWELLVGIMTLIVGKLAWANQVWRRQEQVRWDLERERAAQAKAQCELSPKERALLPLHAGC